MPDPQIITSALSTRIMVEGHKLQIKIFRLEHETTWTLEVVDEDGTSTVWNDSFETDRVALKVVFKTIEEEGLSAFRDTDNIVAFPEH
ncbi:MAG: hypothetical protein QGF16_14630 [Rhodospirillales bacterium]|jgi:hypothetical protein|nr:hypothetical protein [Rhodospirillales bacterium]|tara:strand:+ start:847 stop:1110 length:264 start_codon:yes stop_codon:yes gene_type:complete